MARLITDGAESGDTGKLSGYSANTEVSTTRKRHGTYSYKLIGGSPTGYARYYFDSAKSEIFIRHSIYVESAFVDEYRFVQFIGSDYELKIIDPETAVVRVGLSTNTGTILSYSEPIQWKTGEWHCIEVRYKASATVGVCQMKFDNKLVYDFSGNTNATNLTGVTFFGPVTLSGGITYVDDIAVNDTSGGVDDSWIGDGGVLAALVPTGSGATSNWTSSSGTAWQDIDEIPHNSDTDYISTSTVNDKSTFALANTTGLPTDSTIDRVWIEFVGKKLNAGTTDTIKTVLRSGGTDYEDSVGEETTLSYVRYEGDHYLVDPADSAAWTTGKIDALEIGVKLST